MEWSGGGKWDNYNSIINKYINKKRMTVAKQEKVKTKLQKVGGKSILVKNVMYSLPTVRIKLIIF